MLCDMLFRSEIEETFLK